MYLVTVSTGISPGASVALSSSFMPWEEGIQSFGELLYRLIKKHGSIRGFAPKLGVNHSFLSHIHTGLTPPPLDRVEGWADTLGLEGKEREYFLDLAALACAPDRVLRMFEANHPAFDAIRLAIENSALKRLYAAEVGVPYVSDKSPRKSRRSQP